MADLFQAVVDLWDAGGFVMPWLVASTVILWWAIGERAWSVRPGILNRAQVLATTIPAHRRTPGRVHEALMPLREGLERHRVLIQSVAGTAPLVGLLGTVTGMIETFDALTTMSMFSSTGGIAGGISAALVSTQMGLAVAIPGMLASRLLERRQHVMEDALEALAVDLSTLGREAA